MSGALLYKFRKIINECDLVVFTSHERHMIIRLGSFFVQFIIAFMLEDAQVSVLLTQQTLVETLPQDSAKSSIWTLTSLPQEKVLII